MRLLPALLTGAWVLLPVVLGRMEFINPPPLAAGSTFSQNQIYPEGKVVNVAWTPSESGRPVSLTLWQLDPNTAVFFGTPEYITQNAINSSRLSWIVATAKNLTVSNLFFLSIFEEGRTASDSDTQYFNITRGSTAAVSAFPTSPTAGTGTPTSQLLTSVSTTAVAAPNETATSTPSSIPAPSSGLNTGAQIGIGVGISIPCAIALSVLTSWCFLRARRKRDNAQALPSSMIAIQGQAPTTLVPSHYHYPTHYHQQSPPSKFSDVETTRSSLHELHAPTHEYSTGR